MRSRKGMRITASFVREISFGGSPAHDRSSQGHLAGSPLPSPTPREIRAETVYHGRGKGERTDRFPIRCRSLVFTPMWRRLPERDSPHGFSCCRFRTRPFSFMTLVTPPGKMRSGKGIRMPASFVRKISFGGSPAHDLSSQGHLAGSPLPSPSLRAIRGEARIWGCIRVNRTIFPGY